MNLKVSQWNIFSKNVCSHIRDYVIPQYGDFPDEHIDGMSLEEIKGKISSYVQRMGKVHIHRGYKGAVQDMFKIAHFACYAAFRLSKKDKE